MNELQAVWHFGELKSEEELDVNFISQSRTQGISDYHVQWT